MENKLPNKEIIKELGDLLIYSVKNREKVKRVYIGFPSPKLVQQALKFNVNLQDKKIYVDSSALRHSFNKHGIKSINVKNGATPLCPFDLMYLPDMIQTGKVVGFKNDCLEIERNSFGVIGGIVLELLISNKKGNRLYLKTMYNTKIKRG